MNPRNLSLIRAVTEDDIEAVRALVAAGSDLNKPTSGGQTPLILAIVLGHLRILRFLLEAGADPQVCDDLGLNAVDWAERRGFAEGLKILAQHKTAKQGAESGTPTAKPILSDSPVPNQDKKQNTLVSDGTTQIASSYEKSRRWIAGLKLRIDEEASHEVKELQPRTEIEPPPEREAVRAVVNDQPPLSLPKSKPEPGSLPDSDTNIASDTAQLENQTPLSETNTPIVPRSDVVRAQSSSLTSTTSPTSSSRKRCPTCNAAYNSELLAYCAVDMTPLVDADQPWPPTPAESARKWLVWVAILITFLIAFGVTSQLLRKLQNNQTVPAATPSQEAAREGTSPLFAGELSGKQLNVPEPDYPLGAKNAHVSGTVTIRAKVDKTGKVIEAKVIEGDRRLRNSALAAARKTTFSPEKLLGREAVGTIVYTFKD